MQQKQQRQEGDVSDLAKRDIFLYILVIFLGPRIVSAMLKLVTASPGFSRTVLHFMDVSWI